jgi:hypothetical protein
MSRVRLRRRRTLLLASIGAVGLLVATPSRALDLTLEVFHDAEYSTNLARSSGTTTEDVDDEEDGGWILQPGARLGLTHDTPNITLSGDYDIRRRLYQEDGYDDDTVATGTGSLTWRALPDRLIFDVSNSRTETTIDSRDPFAPDNRQVTSTTAAGATLQIDSFGAQFLSLGYRYGWQNTNETDSDSETQTGTLAYVFPLSSMRRVQINGVVSDEDFDDELTPDTTTYGGDLQYVSTGATIDVDMALGYTLVDRELDRDDVDGITGRGSFVWHVSSVTSASLTYAHAITSETPDALTGIPDFGEEFDENSGLNEVYTSDDVGVSFSTEVGRNRVTLGATYRKLDYEDVPNDEETAGASFSIERRIRPTVTGSLFSSISRTEFDIDDRQDDRWDSGVRISWEGFKRLTIALSGSYFQQESDDEFNDYDEWRGVISLGYRLIGAR